MEVTVLQNFSSHFTRLIGVVVLAFSLVACGGGGDQAVYNQSNAGNNSGGGGVTTPTQPIEPTGQGALKASTLLGTIAPADISAALAANDALIPGLKPRYAVTSYRLEYTTIGADGQLVRASGLVSVPVKTAGATSPVLSYQHGTIFRDAEAPSNNAVASEVVVAMASLGYMPRLV